MSLKRIAARLGVSVGSVHLWTKDIDLTEEQQLRNREREQANRRSFGRRSAAWSERCRVRRRGYQSEGRTRARIGGDPLHHAGCMLYWAEGAKERNSAKLANSDPHMLRLYCRFLMEALGVTTAEIKLRLNVYLGNHRSLRAIETYWLDLLQLPRSTLRGHTLNHLPTSSSGKKKDRLPYGVCTITVNRTDLVQHIFGAIQEYGGFDEPGWLDGPSRKTRP